MENNISGITFKKMIISASNSLSGHKQEINGLNVFPVPDGDTGTNMSMTMEAAARVAASLDKATVSEVANAAASSMLRGARGNSGVILSLFFRGVSHAFNGLSEVTGSDLSRAMQYGVEEAYKAVMKPTEGTILTVARLACEKATEVCGRDTSRPADFKDVLSAAVDGARDALAKTPDMLPVLKKAGVVDSGGRGYVVALEAMLAVLDGKPVEKEETSVSSATLPLEASSENGITFTYCTEFIINTAGPKKNPDELRAFLQTIGDCVLVAADGDIIKVHCHTDSPDRAIGKSLEYGWLDSIKIDNMRVQAGVGPGARIIRKTPGPDLEKKIYGIVAVAAGDGMISAFSEIGADAVVDGGETMNPSTDDILKAANGVNADTIFIFPDNKNVIMAAEQAAPLCEKRVYVVHTKTIPQGMSAILAFDPDASYEDNIASMEDAMESVKTGLIVKAARNAVIGLKRVSKGDVLAFEDGKLLLTEKDSVTAASRLAVRMSDRSTSSVTLFYGGGISDTDAGLACGDIEKIIGRHAEVTAVDGGQPVYDFIISAG